MQKFIIICLTLSFLFSPISLGVYMQCVEKDGKHLCQMHDEEKDQHQDHSCNCHQSLPLAKVEPFSFSVYQKKSAQIILGQNFNRLELIEYLDHPPIV